MADNPEVISARQRDDLFNRLRDDPAFRETMKRDWRAAVRELGINPEQVAKGALSRREVADFLAQRAGWTIEIIIFSRFSGAESVEVGEAVNFAAR